MKENLPNTVRSAETLKGGPLPATIPICVGKNIRTLRKERQMTQKDLATAIGCEPSYISHIERVSRSISIRHLFQIADAMKTTPATLVTEKSGELGECLALLQKLEPEQLKKVKAYLEDLAKSSV